MPDVIIRPADRADLPAVLAIYNDAVLHTTAIWNDTAVDLEDRERWFQQRTDGDTPCWPPISVVPSSDTPATDRSGPSRATVTRPSSAFMLRKITAEKELAVFSWLRC